MIIEKVICNIKDLSKEEIGNRHIERINIESDLLVKRIQRLTTDHKREVGVRLKEAKDLVQGDVLYMDDKNMIIINVLNDDLLVIQPEDMEQMGRVAHEIGNRHLPAQFEGKEMLVQYDYLTEELLKELGVNFIREERQVKHAFRHIGH